MNESFHVRSPIPKDERLRGEGRAKSLERGILASFQNNPRSQFSEYAFEGMALSTSIRRALCNLKKQGLIDACHPSEKIMGKYGVHIFTYKLSNPQPAQQLEAPWMNNQAIQ